MYELESDQQVAKDSNFQKMRDFKMLHFGAYFFTTENN